MSFFYTTSWITSPRNYIGGLESEIRNCEIRNPKLRNPKSEIAKSQNPKSQNPKSEIAKSEIAESETQRVRYWVNRSVSDSAEGEEIENIGFNRVTVAPIKYRVQSVRQSARQAVRQSCVNRRVKGASIDASNIWFSGCSIGASPTQKYLLSDKTIGASKVRQSARLRRRNIWFSGCSIGASPTLKYPVQSNRHRSRISFRYGSIGASKMRQISGSPTAQSARHRITLIVSNCIRAKLP